MLMSEYQSDYYMWLLERVEGTGMFGALYSKLLRFLFDTKYTYTFVMDGNRAKGGESLRSIFAAEEGVFIEDVHSGPCTVLEMIEALATEMAFDKHDSISRWFWELLDNLGLMVYKDDNFNEKEIKDILNRWMSRNYEPDGKGSLFPIPGFDGDMRNVEIWDQMNIYMTKLYPVGEWLT